MRTSTRTRKSKVAFQPEEFYRVLKVIPVGRFNGTNVPAIATAAGIKDDGTHRRTREMIRFANLRGIPVVVDPYYGIYYAEHQAEIDRYIESIERRQLALAERVEGLRKAVPANGLFE